MAWLTRRLPTTSKRHRLTLERQETDPLDVHGQHGDWYPRAKHVPASITTLTGRQLENAQRTFAEATHLIELDHMEGLTKRDRFTFRGRTFYIGHVDDVDMAGLVHRVLVVERT